MVLNIEQDYLRFRQIVRGKIKQDLKKYISPGDVDDDGAGQAGNAAGGHILEVDLTMEELAQILAEELELPRIKPKGTARLRTERDRYSQISKVGPESLRHFKRTYKEAL